MKLDKGDEWESNVDDMEAAEDQAAVCCSYLWGTKPTLPVHF